jgi:hypothetical protein
VGAGHPGGPDDLPRLVAHIASGSFPDDAALPVRVVWEVRSRLGALLHWDDDDEGLGSRVPSLRDRLPSDLRDGPSGPELGSVPFTPLYLAQDEWAAELANRTVHAVMHIGWVPDRSGGYRGQMAVLVKPNGRLGALYMAAIKPFRHLVVYPALMRSLQHGWVPTA